MEYKVDIDNSGPCQKIYILKDDLRVAETFYPFNQEEHAKDIVKACNNYESLLNACKTALTAATEIYPGNALEERDRVIKTISDAIKQAEGD